MTRTPWQNPKKLLSAFSDQQVIDALHDLPEEIRLTLLLVDVQQLDQSDAAEILTRCPLARSRAERIAVEQCFEMRRCRCREMRFVK